MAQDVVIKKSKIQGKGVFANHNFKQGEIVLKWCTERFLSSEEANRLSAKDKKYLTCVNRKYLLMQPPERFVNHSCDANTFVNGFCDVAKRDIKKGEEITTDYSRDSPPGFQMECKCKSKKCKGSIISRKGHLFSKNS